jgi:hypothetical protein
MRHLHYRPAVVLLLLLLAAPAWADDIYIDGGCPTQGDGTGGYTETCDGTAAGNPYNDLHDIFPASEACGSGTTRRYIIRGVHTSHGSCPGFDGRYFGDEWAWDQTCTSTTAVTIEPYGYGGTQERVYLDGTRCPKPSTCTGTNCDYSRTGAAANCGVSGTAGAWIQCTWDGTLCDCANTNIVIGDGTQAVCEATWYTSDAGTAGTGFQSASAAGVLWAQKDDGSITYMTRSTTNNDACTGAGAPHACCTGVDTGTCLLDLTNAHTYNDDRCTNAADSTQKWMPCTTNADCLSGETCTAGASSEIDCFRDTAPAPDVIYCRWGAAASAQAPGTAKRPYIGYSNAGVGFTLKKEAAFVTIRGFDFRAHRNSAIYSNGDSDAANRGDLTATDNRIFFNSDTSGSDYGTVWYQANRATVSNNEIAYTNSEGVHCNSYNSSTASVITISGNYIHNQGDQSIMGTDATAGTPVGITCNPAENASSTGNLTGSVIEKNLIVDIQPRPDQTATYGIRMEHCVTGVVIRHNVLVRAGSRQGLTIDASNQGASCVGATSSAQEWYNNIVVDQGHECAEIFVDTGETIDALKFYNNTCVNPGANAGIHTDTLSGTFSNSLIRNNIFSTGTLRCMNIIAPGAGSGNVNSHNVCVSSHATPYNWLGTTYNGTDIDGGCSTNCASSLHDTSAAYPAFAGAADFHLTTSSPAKDAGTATGMPSGRTTDINNTLADDRGFADYSDGDACSGTCDIGADEFIAAASVRKLMVVTGG